MLGVAGGLSIQVGPRRTPAGVAATGAARTLSLGTERHWFPAAVPLDVTAGIAAVLGPSALAGSRPRWRAQATRAVAAEPGDAAVLAIRKPNSLLECMQSSCTGAVFCAKTEQNSTLTSICRHVSIPQCMQSLAKLLSGSGSSSGFVG
jgi:hypothetical protein